MSHYGYILVVAQFTALAATTRVEEERTPLTTFKSRYYIYFRTLTHPDWTPSSFFSGTFPPLVAFFFFGTGISFRTRHSNCSGSAVNTDSHAKLIIVTPWSSSICVWMQ